MGRRTAGRTPSPTASSACWTRWRPGLAASVRAREVITPLDLERDYGLSGGHPLHGEQALDQWFLWRPFLGSAPLPPPGRRALPVRVRRSPGGGITGQPGQNAAREILADLKRRR